MKPKVSQSSRRRERCERTDRGKEGRRDSLGLVRSVDRLGVRSGGHAEKLRARHRWAEKKRVGARQRRKAAFREWEISYPPSSRPVLPGGPVLLSALDDSHCRGPPPGSRPPEREPNLSGTGRASRPSSSRSRSRTTASSPSSPTSRLLFGALSPPSVPWLDPEFLP